MRTDRATAMADLQSHDLMHALYNRPFAGDWSVQLIVGDKRVNVTMRAKGAMTVIIALKGEGLLKAGLPTSLYRLWNQPARSSEHGEHL